jgi:hypothetical protein
MVEHIRAFCNMTGYGIGRSAKVIAVLSFIERASQANPFLGSGTKAMEHQTIGEAAAAPCFCLSISVHGRAGVCDRGSLRHELMGMEYLATTGSTNDQDHPAAAVIDPLSKRPVRRLGCIASFGQPVMYHRPSSKRPQVFGMPSMSQRGQHVRLVVGMFGLSLTWGCRNKLCVLRPAPFVME